MTARGIDPLARPISAADLIGPDGRIARVWPKVAVADHAEEVLAAVKAL